MGFVTNYLAPFSQAPTEAPAKRASVVDGGGERALAKLFKVSSLALGFSGLYGSRTNFEEAPYDFKQIIYAADTDSFVRQGLHKYRELIWKEGWELVGERDESVDYLRERIDYMEFAMRRPFDDLLSDIGDQLVKFGNAFVAKSRGDLGPYFPGKLVTPEDKDPIVGYYLIPAETVEILRDKHNKVKGYRQKISHNLVDGYKARRQPRWSADEVIHFHVDRKPGRAFGTPFLVSVLDDVLSLRQIEEDVLNLVHQELFPLYKYKVGTEEHPAEPHEIDDARVEIENLRTEGGLVLPDRHDVEVVGAEGNSLDASEYLQHFITRVCVGLGLSPHHLGAMMNGGNRSVTDRLDIALYDKIKTYQRYISEMVRLGIFSELLLEGGFDPITHPLNAGESDRVDFNFREIDVDTQVKKETHIIQKVATGLMSIPEGRLALGMDPDMDENESLTAMQARLQPIQTKNQDGSTSTSVPEKPDAASPSTGGRPNQKNNTRGVGNKTRPSNQHGRSTSPKIRHSEADQTWAHDIVRLLDEDEV